MEIENAREADAGAEALAKFKRRSDRLMEEFSLDAPAVVKVSELRLLKESLAELEELLAK